MGLLAHVLVVIVALALIEGSSARTEARDLNALIAIRNTFRLSQVTWPLESIDPCDNPSFYFYTISCLKPSEPHFPYRVGGIHLNAMGLNGTFPNFANLTAVRVIDLGNNFLKGPIEVAKFGPRVEILNLYNNSFTGSIPVLPSNSTIKELYLSRNSFTGTIPSFGGSLEVLSLSSNQLTGPIPDSLFLHTNLTQLFLANNTLSGTISSKIGDLNRLVILALWKANLTGSIPTTIGSLLKLRFLYLDRNNLTGAIPSQLGSLSDLRILYLRDNKLNGTIPTQLSQLSKLTALSLANNQLNSTIPNSFGNLTSLSLLHLYLNPGLVGTIPSSLGSLSQLKSLDLSSGSLNGTLPNSLASLLNNKGFFFFNLAYNNLVGELSATFLNDKPNSTAFIDLRQNSFTCGSLPLWCTQLGNSMCVTSKCLLSNTTPKPVVNAQKKSVNLKWVPSTANSRNILYEAEMTESGQENFTPVYKGSESTATIGGLTQGRTYVFRIRAINSGAVGPWSPALEAVVP